MTDPYGFTRSVVARSYALLTPAGFVAGQVPGWRSAQVVVAISPKMGAGFAQVLVTLGEGGACEGAGDGRSRLVFVLEGAAGLEAAGRREVLSAGGYAYLPPGLPFALGGSAGARLLVFEKPYARQAGAEPPGLLVGHEADVAGAPFLGDEAALLKLLLPDDPAFDMAVNIFTFQPGATLPFVETHVMEHGLLMIQGSGIYRLDSDWHPVRSGDAIWMAPFCPQWFVATGKEPARYIYYKDVNRDPLGV